MHAFLVNAVLLVAGIGLLIEAVKYARRVRLGRASRTWPSVEGVIERSEPVKEHLRGDRRRGYVYVPRIRYAYRVRGREYRGDEVAYGHESLYTSFPDRARRKCEEYPVGARVRVYHDSAQPDVACLERARGSELRGALACLAMTAVAIALLGIVVT